jgi:hypothetical protein
LINQLAQAETDLNNAYDSHNQDQIAKAQAKVNQIAAELIAGRTSSSAPTSTAPS